MKRWFLFFFVVLWAEGFSGAEFSGDYQNDLNSRLQVSPREQDLLMADVSVSHLGVLFGSVGGVLPGNSDSMFGRLFYLFNTGCLMVATLSLGYATLVISIQSAAEGSVMGKKMQQSYFFLMFRQMMSVMFLVPQFSGYAACQVLMMWIVVQGIYLADLVWIRAAEYVMVAQDLVGHVLDVMLDETVMTQAMPGGDMRAKQQPQQAQLMSTSRFVMYAYQATWCATLAPLGQGQSVKGLTFSDLSMTRNDQALTITFPNSCGSLTVQYRGLPQGLNIEQQASLQASMESTVRMGLEIVLGVVSSSLATLQTSGCFAALTQSPNTNAFPASCLAICNGTNAAGYCPVSTPLTGLIRQMASMVQWQTLSTQALSTPKAQDMLSQLFGIGWIGVATQYYRGMHQMQSEASTLASNASSGQSITDFVQWPIAQFSNPVTMFGQQLAPYMSMALAENASHASTNSSTCQSDESKNPYQAWYCQALQLSSQTETIVQNVWTSIGVSPPTFDGSGTWQQLNQNYQATLNSNTSDRVSWDSISPAFWPMMSDFHVGASNAWIRTFLDPQYLKWMVTDPLYTFAQLAKFLTSASITYMIKATGEVAKDLLLFIEGVMAVTSSLVVSAVYVDGIMSYMQEYAQVETNACWFYGEMAMPPAFCLIIWILFIPIFVSTIIGILLQTIFTEIRLVLKVLFDVGLAVLDQIVHVGLAYKMRYITLIFSISVPVLTVASYLAVYIPMLPVLMYTVAVVGWVMLVIEAMLGIPLVLLGMTSLQGHDLLGSAQQAMIMLLSVFIRPVTLVLGFIFGVITLSVFGFLMAMFIVPYLAGYIDLMMQSGANGDALTMGVILGLMMLMYLSIYATIIQFAFSAMFKIPHLVMRWIGLSEASSSEEEIINQIQSEARSQLGSMSSVFGSMQGGLQRGGMALQTKPDLHSSKPSHLEKE